MNDVVPLLKHNPSAQDPAVLEAITVQREPLIAALVEGALNVTGGLRHQLLVGPRGMGKTHILSLVASRVGDDPGASKVVIAWLDEDPWPIRTYDKFLAAIAERIAAMTADPALREKAEVLRSGDGQESLEGEELLREAVGDRRLLLLVENLDEIFRRIRPEGQARFRAFVEGWRRLLIFATAPQLFEGVRRHDSPFYGFFAITHLDELSLDSATELLRRVAELRGDAALLEFLGTETAKKRLEAIESLAGGHPRIWLLLAGCISVAAIDELVPLFLEALDELTPYYQDRLRELSDQQQELVVLLAEAGGALSNRDLSERSGIGQNQVATILRQLTTRGYVRSAEVDESVATGDRRMSFWELREPLMRLCLDVKQARGRPLRMVVEFLRAWYGPRILDELARLPAEAELAAAYAGEAFRTLDAPLPTKDLLRGSADEIISRTEQGLAVAPERIDLKVARATGMLVGERFGDARDALREMLNEDLTGDLTPGLRLLLAMADEGLGEGPPLDVAMGELLAEDVGSSTLTVLIAETYDRLGLTEEALQAFEKAVELDANNAKLHRRYGILASQAGRNEDAVRALSRSIELEPGSPAGYGNLSIPLRRLGRFQEAIEVARKAVELAPDNANVHDILAVALSDAGHYEEALAAHAIARDLAPDDTRILGNLGAVLGRMGRATEALDVFARAAELDPRNANTQANLALALRSNGRAEDALAAIERSAEIDPESGDIRAYLGITLTDLGRHEDALTAFEKAVELDPDNGSFQASVARSLFRLGRIEEAIPIYEHAAELSPENVSILVSLGIALGMQGRSGDALTVFERAVELDPENAAAVRNRCAALANLERNEEALAAIERAVELKPSDAEYREILGVALVNLGRLEDALNALRDAIELDPADPALYARHGDWLERAGRIDEAERAVHHALELDGDVPATLFTAARIALARRDADLALTRLRAALAGWRQDEEGPPGEPDALAETLWKRFEADPNRTAAIAGIVQAYREAGALEELGSGAVASIPLFVDVAVNQTEADAWVADWVDSRASDELEIPLNMLKAAQGWKRDHDRAHLLGLPLEQREILTGLLKTEDAG